MGHGGRPSGPLSETVSGDTSTRSECSAKIALERDSPGRSNHIDESHLFLRGFVICSSAEPPVTIWKKKPRADLERTRGYQLSEFALTLNEPVPAADIPFVPPTDTRFRPDLRAYEQGLITEGSKLKTKIEEKERVALRSKVRRTSPRNTGKPLPLIVTQKQVVMLNNILSVVCEYVH